MLITGFILCKEKNQKTGLYLKQASNTLALNANFSVNKLTKTHLGRMKC